MIDDSTRHDSVEFTMSEYRYNYTIVDRTVDEIDVELFIFQSEVALTTDLCKTESVRESLEAGVRYSYNYADSMGDQIAHIVIQDEDCL